MFSTESNDLRLLYASPAMACGRSVLLTPAQPGRSNDACPILMLPVEGVIRVATHSCEAVVAPERAIWIPGHIEYTLSVGRPLLVYAVRFWRGLEAGEGLEVFTAAPLLREMTRHAVQWGESPPRTEAADAFFTALGGLVGRWRKRVDDVTLPHADSPALRAGLGWLFGRLAHPVGPVDAAVHANLSLRTFQRRCRAELGVSPSAWLQRARVLQGLELLDDDRLSVAEVALRCGYQSQASFGRVFKDHLGVTPVAWRSAQALSPVLA
jgi:AraC-like DNA-binding protein